MLTSHQRPVAQGRVCAGDMPTWPLLGLPAPAGATELVRHLAAGRQAKRRNGAPSRSSREVDELPVLLSQSRASRLRVMFVPPTC
jgi:hypothetical protein